MASCLLIFWILVCFAFAADPVKPTEAEPIEAFVYNARNTLNEVIASGSLVITAREGDTFTGRWKITEMIAGQRPGPQIGSGSFMGVVSEQRVTIRLNPKMRDNNVNLSGELTPEGIIGTWEWSGFAGPMNSGPFEAVLSVVEKKESK